MRLSVLNIPIHTRAQNQRYKITLESKGDDVSMMGMTTTISNENKIIYSDFINCNAQLFIEWKNEKNKERKNEQKCKVTTCSSGDPPTTTTKISRAERNSIRSVYFDAKRATERVFTHYTHNFLDCASFERQRLSGCVPQSHTVTNTYEPNAAYVFEYTLAPSVHTHTATAHACVFTQSDRVCRQSEPIYVRRLLRHGLV